MSPEPRARGVAILGSTGSIGEQALEVARLHPGRLEVRARSAGKRIERLMEQAREFHPEVVCAGSEEDAARAAAELGPELRVVCGPEGLLECATLPGVTIVMNGLVGARGLAPSLAA